MNIVNGLYYTITSKDFPCNDNITLAHLLLKMGLDNAVDVIVI